MGSRLTRSGVAAQARAGLLLAIAVVGCTSSPTTIVTSSTTGAVTATTAAANSAVCMLLEADELATAAGGEWEPGFPAHSGAVVFGECNYAASDEQPAFFYTMVWTDRYLNGQGIPGGIDGQWSQLRNQFEDTGEQVEAGDSAYVSVTDELSMFAMRVGNTVIQGVGSSSAQGIAMDREAMTNIARTIAEKL